jgi:hypothetical protein
MIFARPHRTGAHLAVFRSNISYFENSLFQIARFYVLILTWE